MNLKLYLKSNNITQTEFAKKLQVTRTYVSMIARGYTTPGRLLAREIAILTNGAVTIGELLNIDKKKKNKQTDQDEGHDTAA